MSPKDTHYCPLFFIIIMTTVVTTSVPTFTSSIIASISDVHDDNLVDITYKTSDEVYTYQISDVDAWQNDLNDTISEDESVGAFVNRARKSMLLQEV